MTRFGASLATTYVSLTVSMVAGVGALRLAAARQHTMAFVALLLCMLFAAMFGVGADQVSRLKQGGGDGSG